MSEYSFLSRSRLVKWCYIYAPKHDWYPSYFYIHTLLSGSYGNSTRLMSTMRLRSYVHYFLGKIILALSLRKSMACNIYCSSQVFVVAWVGLFHTWILIKVCKIALELLPNSPVGTIKNIYSQPFLHALWIVFFWQVHL